MYLKTKAPSAILYGVNDISKPPMNIGPKYDEKVPTFLTHLFLFTQKGEREPMIHNKESAYDLLGEETFNLRGKYATHQTVLAKHLLEEKETYCVIHRLDPGEELGASTATLALSLEVVKTELDEYKVNYDGSYVLDPKGDKIFTGRKIPGFKLAWKFDRVELDDFGQRPALQGKFVTTNDDTVQVINEKGEFVITEDVTRIPVCDWKINGWGDKGNLIGIKLWSVPWHRLNRNIVGSSLEHPWIYGFEIVEKLNEESGEQTLSAKDGQYTRYWSFKDIFYHATTKASMRLDDVSTKDYSLGKSNPPEDGPFEEVYFYSEFMEDIHKQLYKEELKYNPSWPTKSDSHFTLNLFEGKDKNQVPYKTIVIADMADGGEVLNKFNTFYCRGGSDGDLSLENYEKLVKYQLDNYGYLEHKFLDMGYWPQSALVDTGFSLDVKPSFITAANRRKDLAIIWSTQDLAQPPNTEEKENSIAVYLKTISRYYAESDIYYTDFYRAIIIPHCGKLHNSAWRSYMPLTLAACDIFADYMGDPSGIWRKDRGYDQDPYNNVNLFIPNTVNLTWKTPESYERDFEDSMSSILYANRKTLKFAYIQTIYNTYYSPLNSSINMWGMVEINKIVYRSWTKLLNGGKLSPKEFLQSSDNLILGMLEHNDKFDRRFTFEVKTYFNDMDRVRGYSWCTQVTVYGRNGFRIMQAEIRSDQSPDFFPATSLG